MGKILVLDNYDSFTWNLVHMVESILHTKVDVFRNDRIELDAVDKYQRIILSPGPGLPSEAGLLIPIIRKYAPFKSILGVCLGHQAIAKCFGGSLINLEDVFHGVARNCNVVDTDAPLFQEIPQRFEAGRYHSWVVDQETLPGELRVTATDDGGRIMAMQHSSFDIQSVQFHPESVLTPYGRKILENWLMV